MKISIRSSIPKWPRSQLTNKHTHTACGFLPNIQYFLSSDVCKYNAKKKQSPERDGSRELFLHSNADDGKNHAEIHNILTNACEQTLPKYQLEVQAIDSKQIRSKSNRNYLHEAEADVHKLKFHSMGLAEKRQLSFILMALVL